MTFRSALVALLLLGAALPSTALAGQAAGMPAPVQSPGQSDADALAAQMRVLAENPENLDALVEAGVLATRIGDLSGANAFFTRADRISPDDPRLLAGKASLAVRQEQPGQALRLFDRAAAQGYRLDDYLPDRGLAYDLTGDQARAQRDYRDALKRHPNDETTRRLALSLGISGKRDQALELLDPLVRRSDRGAWRVRAFVLAMTGDTPGAEQIANAMLPPTMASGLRHFFVTLPTLGPVDQAFAVHFGELRQTPERVADARLAPALPPLAVSPEPRQPVAVAALPKPAPAKGKHKRQPPAVVPAPSPPAQVAAVRPDLPPPPREELVTVEQTPPTQIARADTPPVRPAPLETPRPAAPVSRPADSTVQPRPATPPAAQVVPPAPKVEPTPAPPPATPRVEPAPAPQSPPPAPQSPPPASQPDMTPAPQPVRGLPERPSETITPASPTVTLPPSPAPVRGDDRLLETIVSGLAEKPAAAPRPAEPPRAEKPAVQTPPKPVKAEPPKVAKAEVADDCLPPPTAKKRGGKASPAVRSRHASSARCDSQQVADRGKADGDKKARPGQGDDEVDCATVSTASKARGKGKAALASRTGRRAKPAPCPVDQVADADQKQAKGSRADADQDCAPAPAKGRKGAKAPVARKGARGARAGNCPADQEAKANGKGKDDSGGKEPARYWVQVAGGAFEGDLIKAWEGVKAKAPAAFKGRQAWTTPLKATNRVLTGPFKTSAEAQAFVNMVAKSGISAFVFHSEPGQKIDRLGVK